MRYNSDTAKANVTFCAGKLFRFGFSTSSPFSKSQYTPAAGRSKWKRRPHLVENPSGITIVSSFSPLLYVVIISKFQSRINLLSYFKWLL